jgi:hypothetical protein
MSVGVRLDISQNPACSIVPSDRLQTILGFWFPASFLGNVKTTVGFAARPPPFAEISMFPIAKFPTGTKDAVSPHPADNVNSASDTEDEFAKFSVGSMAEVPEARSALIFVPAMPLIGV